VIAPGGPVGTVPAAGPPRRRRSVRQTEHLRRNGLDWCLTTLDAHASKIVGRAAADGAPARGGTGGGRIVLSLVNGGAW